MFTLRCSLKVTFIMLKLNQSADPIRTSDLLEQMLVSNRSGLIEQEHPHVVPLWGSAVCCFPPGNRCDYRAQKRVQCWIKSECFRYIFVSICCGGVGFSFLLTHASLRYSDKISFYLYADDTQFYVPLTAASVTLDCFAWSTRTSLSLSLSIILLIKSIIIR